MKKLICFPVLIFPILTYANIIDDSTSTNDFNYFLGLKGGIHFADDRGYSSSTPSSGVYGIYGGIKFSDSMSWDLGYQSHTKLSTDDTHVQLEGSFYETSLQYNWYLSESVSLYGRLGATYWNSEKNSPLGKVNTSGFSPLGGVGFTYDLDENLSTSLGYQYIDAIGDSHMGKFDSHSVLIGLSYVFGVGDDKKSNSEPIVFDKPIESPEIETPVIKNFPSTTYQVPRFEFDSNYSKEQGAIDVVAKILKEFPQSQVSIIGHTDNIGKVKYNELLSERRAIFVQDQLISRGVKVNQITVHGKGDSQPIMGNETYLGRLKNRRVDIVIHCFDYELKI